MKKLKYNVIIELPDEIKIYIVKDETQMFKLIAQYKDNEIEIKPII